MTLKNISGKAVSLERHEFVKMGKDTNIKIFIWQLENDRSSSWLKIRVGQGFIIHAIIPALLAALYRFWWKFYFLS